jgi:hypothetical protein
MARYLMTHSLLSSWLYAMQDNPYEDATSDKDSLAEFMLTLRREPTPTTEAMQRGIDFENLVTAIVNGEQNTPPDLDKWYNAANEVASIVRGGCLQYKAKKEIVVAGITFLLYGRLDALKAGVIYDIKFSSGYEKGKYVASTQHPAYLELIPEAREFTYLVSNGGSVWKETYRRDEASDIRDVISDFASWLEENNLMDVYKEHWEAK